MTQRYTASAQGNGKPVTRVGNVAIASIAGERAGVSLDAYNTKVGGLVIDIRFDGGNNGAVGFGQPIGSVTVVNGKPVFTTAEARRIATESDHAVRNARGKFESLQDFAKVHAWITNEEWELAVAAGFEDAEDDADEDDAACIADMAEVLASEGISGDTFDDLRESLEQRINEWPLSLTIRGEKDGRADEWNATGFELLLTTGGPGARLVADIDEDGTVKDAKVEWQDWFKPWTALEDVEMSSDILDMLTNQFGTYASGNY